MEIFQLNLPENPIFQAALQVVKSINKSGGKSFFVGGAVRNLLLGKSVKDVDIVCNLPPAKLLEVFPEAQIAGASFGVIIVRINELNFEIASAREERFYMDGRHPEEVRYTKDFEVDSARRDFTVNAMLYDPEKQQVLDYHNGAEDLKKGILRTVGEPLARFEEDYLRMLRLIRFAAGLDFTIEAKTFAALKKLAGCCKKIASERIKQELDLMFSVNSAFKALELLSTSGILKEILPEVDALKGVEQHPIYHPEGDVFIHTQLMLRKMVFPSRNLAWSIILHDCGKVPTMVRTQEGVHFYGHEVESEKIAENIMTRLRFDRQSQKNIAQAVRNHMRFASVTQMKPAKIKRLIADENFPLELELHRLDCEASHRFMDCFVFLLDEIAELKENIKLPPPLINGKLLLKLGYKSGPKFKEIIDFIYDEQLSGKISDEKSAISLIKKHF